MNIKFTHHAQFRLYERNFTVEQMKQAILNPDIARSTSDGKIVSKRKFIDGTIEVVYVQRKNTYIIITVYISK